MKRTLILLAAAALFTLTIVLAWKAQHRNRRETLSASPQLITNEDGQITVTRPDTYATMVVIADVPKTNMPASSNEARPKPR
jgi:hypothetical protein